MAPVTTITPVQGAPIVTPIVDRKTLNTAALKAVEKALATLDGITLPDDSLASVPRIESILHLTRCQVYLKLALGYKATVQANA